MAQVVFARFLGIMTDLQLVFDLVEEFLVSLR